MLGSFIIALVIATYDVVSFSFGMSAISIGLLLLLFRARAARRRPSGGLAGLVLLVAGLSTTELRAQSWRPFAGKAAAAVTVNAPSGDTARKTAALIERLAALGVHAEAGGEVDRRVTLRVTGAREPAALVGTLLKGDWWKLHLVEPEQRLTPSPPPSGPLADWRNFSELKAEPVGTVHAPRPCLSAPDRRRLVARIRERAADRPIGIDCAGNGACAGWLLRAPPWLASESAARAVLRSALRPELGEHPEVAIDRDWHPDDQELKRHTDEWRVAIELTEGGRELARLDGENVDRRVAIVVGGEIVLFGTIRSADRLELAFDGTREAGERSARALLRLIETRGSVEDLEVATARAPTRAASPASRR
jgi:hypothetical protein